jgi:hypothetical protein
LCSSLIYRSAGTQRQTPVNKSRFTNFDCVDAAAPRALSIRDLQMLICGLAALLIVVDARTEPTLNLLAVHESVERKAASGESTVSPVRRDPCRRPSRASLHAAFLLALRELHSICCCVVRGVVDFTAESFASVWATSNSLRGCVCPVVTRVSARSFA